MQRWDSVQFFPTTNFDGRPLTTNVIQIVVNTGFIEPLLKCGYLKKRKTKPNLKY